MIEYPEAGGVRINHRESSVEGQFPSSHTMPGQSSNPEESDWRDPVILLHNMSRTFPQISFGLVRFDHEVDATDIQF